VRFVLGDGMETWGREGHAHARLGVRSSLRRRCDAIDRHKHGMNVAPAAIRGRPCLSLTGLESVETRNHYQKRNRCRVPNWSLTLGGCAEIEQQDNPCKMLFV
jgi:hypothetical protein